MNEIKIVVKSDNDVHGGLDGARRDIKKFSDDSVKVGTTAGLTMGKNFGASLTTSVSSAGASMGPILAGVGALAAPLVASTMAAAVVGGAGIGGVVGGLVIASKDPRVAAAGASLADDVMKDLETKAAVFVEPAIKGIGTIREGFKEIGPDLDSIFGNSARFVDPLVKGIVAGAKGIIHGVRDAVAAAGPVVEAFSRSFDKIGNAVGDAFTTLAQDADTGANAIDDLTDSVVSFIKVSAEITHGLAQIHDKTEDLDTIIDSTRYKWEDLVSWLDVTADTYAKGSKEAEAYRRYTLGTATAADEALLAETGLAGGLVHLTKAQKDQIKTTKNQVASLDELSDKLRAQVDPAFAFLDAQNDVANAQEDVNAAIKRFGRNSPEARAAYRGLATAAIDLQGKAGGAAGALDGKMTPAMRRTLSAAGLTAKQIAAVERELRDAKAAADAYSGKYFADVYTRYHGVNVSSNERVGKDGHRIGGYAHGGIVGAAASGGMRGGRTLVGEGGPEYVDLPPSTNVHPAGTTRNMMMNGSGGAAQKIVLEFAPMANSGNQLADAIMEMLRNAVRVQGGGNVQLVLGRG